jgi:hypothetical protein
MNTGQILTIDTSTPEVCKLNAKAIGDLHA